jgi:hypothetical protein
MWLVRVALERPYTFVVLALLVLILMDASVLLVNALRGARRASSLPTLHELIHPAKHPSDTRSISDRSSPPAIRHGATASRTIGSTTDDSSAF